MNVIVICGSILIILVVIVTSISIVKDYKDKLIEINNSKRRLDEDFDRLELRYGVESDVIRKVNNDSISLLNNLEESIKNHSTKNNKEIREERHWSSPPLKFVYFTTMLTSFLGT